MNETTMVTITVTDGGNNRFMDSLEITVINVDDESPSMIRVLDASRMVIGTVEAEEEMEMVLGTLTATDSDTQANRLSYSLADDRFMIEKRGVNYLLKSLELLDFEASEVVDGTLSLALTVDDRTNAETIENLIIKVLDRDTRVDDRFNITDGSFMIDGGSGFDVLVMNGDFDLDLTALADNRLRNIEEIDVTGTGDNVLTMDLDELVAIGVSRLYVTGDSRDILIVTDEWEEMGSDIRGGNEYDIYERMQGGNSYELFVLSELNTLRANFKESFEITSSSFSAIDGGAGFDVLVMDGDFDLDLTAIGNNLLRNIEEIDVTGDWG